MNELLQILGTLKPDVDFTKEKNLVEDGLLDSLDIVQIIAQIEKAFGVKLSADDIDPDNFESAQSIWSMISKYRKSLLPN